LSQNLKFPTFTRSASSVTSRVASVWLLSSFSAMKMFTVDVTKHSMKSKSAKPLLIIATRRRAYTVVMKTTMRRIR